MDDWDERVAAVWAAGLGDTELVARIDALASERPAGDAAALFERAGARDSTGDEEGAAALYEEAMAAGLDDERAPQALIQYASTIRNLGRAREAADLLEDWLVEHPDHRLADAARAFLALSYTSLGRDRDAAALALATLGPHLPAYTRSVAAYAAEL